MSFSFFAAAAAEAKVFRNGNHSGHLDVWGTDSGGHRMGDPLISMDISNGQNVRYSTRGFDDSSIEYENTIVNKSGHNDEVWVGHISPTEHYIGHLGSLEDSLKCNYPFLLHNDVGMHLYYIVDLNAYTAAGSSFHLDTNQAQQYSFVNGVCSQLPGYLVVASNLGNLDIEEVFNFTTADGFIFSGIGGAALFSGTAVAIAEESIGSETVPSLNMWGLIILGAILAGIAIWFTANRSRKAVAGI